MATVARLTLSRKVKMLSILAYFVSRNFIDVLRAYESLPQHILQLLQNLPPELLSTRKELIIATRHFFASELRTHFQTHVDALLNEATILGVCVCVCVCVSG